MKTKNYILRLLIGGIFAFTPATAQQTLTNNAGLSVFPAGINLRGDVVGSLQDFVSFASSAFHYSNNGLSASVSPLSVLCLSSPCSSPSSIYAVAINDNGLIIGGGFKLPGWTYSKGWICTAPCGGNLTMLDVSNGANIYPQSVNKTGVITGIWDDTHSVTHAFIRDERGRVTKFDAPNVSRSAPTTNTLSMFVNGNGDTAGHFVDATNKYHIYFRTAKGQVSTFDIPNSQSLGVAGINNTGAIIGTYTGTDGRSRGFIVTGIGRKSTPSVTTCDNPTAASEQGLSAINNNGIALGVFADSAGYYHAFRCDSNGAVSSLDYGPAGTSTFVSGLNDNNVYVSGYAAGQIFSTASQAIIRTLP